jgi:hypothetical protein
LLTGGVDDEPAALLGLCSGPFCGTLAINKICPYYMQKSGDSTANLF